MKPMNALKLLIFNRQT